MLSFLKAILKEIKIVAPLLIHKTQQTLKYDPPFQDAGPRQNSLDILLERWIQDGGGSLDHAAYVMGLLTWIGIPIKHTQLLVKQIVGLIAHTELRRSQCAVGKFLRFMEEAIRRHGVQNLDCASRFLQVVLFSGQTVSKNRSPCVEAADGVIRSGSLGKERGNPIVDRKEVVILASHFLRGLKCFQKMIRDFLGPRQRPDRRVFHEPVLKGIPRVSPFIRFSQEVSRPCPPFTTKIPRASAMTSFEDCVTAITSVSPY